MDAIGAAQALSEIGYLLRQDPKEIYRARAFSAAAWALGRLAGLTGDLRYTRAAEETVALFYPQMRDSPAAYATMSMALAKQLQPPALLVLRGQGDAPLRPPRACP